MNVLNLDVFTISILIGIGNLMSLLLYAKYKNLEIKEKTDYIYLSSKFTGIIGWCLIGFRNKISYFLSFDVGNAFVMLCLFLETLELEKEIAYRKKIYKLLKEMSTLDDLTGLPNRKLFYDHLNYSIKTAKKTNLFLAQNRNLTYNKLT